MTLLDGASIDRQIRQYARDPRYSTVLTMRPGVATRSSSDSAATQLIPRDPPQPATQISERLSQPATSENVGGDDRATPALPAIPVFFWIHYCGLHLLYPRHQVQGSLQDA